MYVYCLSSMCSRCDEGNRHVKYYLFSRNLQSGTVCVEKGSMGYYRHVRKDDPSLCGNA